MYLGYIRYLQMPRLQEWREEVETSALGWLQIARELRTTYLGKQGAIAFSVCRSILFHFISIEHGGDNLRAGH